LQQLRQRVAGDEGYRFVIHDRDSIYSKELDAALKTFGLCGLEGTVQVAPGKLVL
jgi:hypothetical protein